MLAGAGVDRQYEHEPSWAPRPFGGRGGCDRELHADADGRVYACQPALGRVVRGAAVGGLVHFCEQGFTPLLRGGHRCPEIRRNAGARLRRFHGALQLEARQFDLFHPRAREPQWLLLPKEARQTVANLMARILRERVLRNRRTEALGGSRDY
jgi:hypothetical protein